MPYCSKCGKELREDDRFCPACGYPVETEKEEKGNVNEAQSESSSHISPYVILLLVFVLLPLGYLGYVTMAPLDNDADCYKAGREAHEALSDLRNYGAFSGYSSTTDECSETCPICHPMTWRWKIRKMRGDAPF